MALIKIAKKIKRFVAYPPRSLGTIYMLHRCAPINQNNLYWNEHMKVSPEYLKKFLQYHSKTHEFISLDTLYEISRAKKRLKKPFIVITFDDGYRDNYEYALPIFDEMHIPFAVYVSNSFPEKNAFLWWYILENIIQKNEDIVLSDGNKYICRTKTEKEKLFLQLLSLILKLNQEKLETEFNSLFCSYAYDSSSYNEEACLSWNMIKEMANSDYCTIAAHTMNHKTLNQLTDVELEYEVLNGKKELEDKIRKSINHFAYPFGTFNEVGIREVECIKKYFNTACYAFGGGVYKKHLNKPCELPREFFGELSR